MANNDIFAPPSAEETGIFAPPSPEDTGGPSPDVSQLESALRGGAQGLSLGYADELAGAAGAAGSILSGSPISQLADSYRQNRDESRQLYSAAQEANPATYLAGEVGGGVAGALIPGLGAVKGVKGAAALGGLAGLGTSSADLTQGDVGGAVLDTATGAALGGLVGAAGEKISGAIKGAPKKLENLANEAQYGAIGAGAKDVAKDLGLGRTVFPGKEATDVVEQGTKKALDLRRNMAQTLREKEIPQLTGGSQAHLTKIDEALSSNRESYNKFFGDIDAAVSQKAANNPNLSLPTAPGTVISETGGKPLIDQFRALSEGFQSDISKRFGGSAAAAKLKSDVADYSGLLQDADFSLPKLNELKQILGKQLSETDWYTASPDLAPQKDFLKKLYGLVKGRMEGLADSVSPGAGETMRKLNQEYGNLATARGIAFKQHTKELSGPMLGPLDIAGAVAAIGTSSPGILAAVGTKKALEYGTGNSIDRLSKIATAKTLDSLSKSLNASADPAASGLAAELYKLSQNPSVVARVSALSGLLADPTNKKLFDEHMSEAPKDVQVKTPITTTGGQRVVNAGYDNVLGSEDLEGMAARITPDMGTSGSQLKNILTNLKDKDSRARNAMIFALQQNPAYRPMLKKLKEEQK